MIYRLEEVATFDEDGRVDGMQFDSRARRLQEWREKKEDREFAVLIAKLRAKNRWQAWYARHKDDPAFRERLRNYNRRQKDKHRSRRNAEFRAYYQAEVARKEPTRNVCQECQSVFWQEAGFKKKRFAKYCSSTCRSRACRRRKPRRKKGREKVMAVLEAHPNLTAAEVAKRLEISDSSVRTWLQVLYSEGLLRRSVDRPFRYSVL